MRICVITGMYPTPLYSYAGVYITRRISALKSLGQEVEAYALVPRESPLMRRLRTILGRRANEEVNDVILSDDPSVTYKAVKVSLNLLEFALNRLLRERYFIWKASHALTQATGKQRFDLIHAHWLYPSAAAALKYAQKVGTPCFVSSHGSEINRDMKGAFRKECLATLEGADCAEFVSCALRDAAISFGYSGRNAHVMPNGVEMPDIPNGHCLHKENINTLGTDNRNRAATERNDKLSPVENRGSRNKKRVGFVGNLLPVKRADQFPQIFSRIVEEYKQRAGTTEKDSGTGESSRTSSSAGNVEGEVAARLPEIEFIIIGEGPLMEPLKREFAALPQLKVTFTGRLPHSEVMEQMREMDVLLFPSRNEGWGCVALEAQACGTTPVGSTNGGIPEAIGYKELCVEDTTSFIEDYAARVVDVLTGRISISHEELMERASKYTWLHLQEQEIAQYRKILEQKSLL